MHKNIGRLGTTGYKAKPAESVEPFHHHSFPVALRDDDNVGALGQLRWMDGRRIVHTADADGLQTLFTPHDFADRAGALAGGLEAAASEAGHMQENVGKVVIGHDKPVPL